MIIDDDDLMGETLQDIFQEEGYNVATASNGREAINKVEQTVFDVAIIDIKLPDMDGIALLRKFKKVYTEMICIIITGYSNLQNAISALKDGADGYFVKPIFFEELLHRTHQELEKQRLRRELKQTEKDFRTAVKNSPDFIVFIKADGTIFDVNRLEKGFTKEMVINQSIFNRIFYETEDQCESARKAINDSLETRETTQFEYSQIAPNGSISYYQTRVSPFGYDNEDKIISLQLVTRDITERKKTEESLREIDKYNFLLESLTDGVLIIDREWR
ncbi:MAG: response regulator, partial [Candidatus Heimdallarchaeota archaeon]|nr:response regulator [Candidatus Heimdallarchaeota archaeon]